MVGAVIAKLVVVELVVGATEVVVVVGSTLVVVVVGSTDVVVVVGSILDVVVVVTTDVVVVLDAMLVVVVLPILIAYTEGDDENTMTASAVTKKRYVLFMLPSFVCFL